MPTFALEDCLYEGPATRVFRARDAAGAPVVLKFAEPALLRAEMALYDALPASRFVVEAKGVVDSEEGLALVLHDDGHARVRPESGLAAREAVQIAHDVAAGLAVLHTARVVHRDIKPSNILVDPETGRAKLMDLGVAARLPEGVDGVPCPQLVGTLHYVPPEQTGRTQQLVDARADLYSLGAALFHMLTGQPPFSGADTLEVLSQHLAAPVPRVSDVAPWVPAVVSAIVSRLLQKSPDARYQTAAGLEADLACCLRTWNTEDDTVAPFELGGDDAPPLAWPGAVLGRDDALGTLRAAAALAAEGTPQLVCVTGPSGAGKRALIEAHAGAEEERGMLVLRAACEPGGPPLLPIRAVLAALAAHALGFDEAGLEALRIAFKRSLSGSGQVLVDLAPDFAQILGPQPALAELGPAEAAARLQFAIRQAVQCVTAGAPCIVVLTGGADVDPASAGVLQALTSQDGLPLLVLVAGEAPLESQVLALGAVEPAVTTALVAAALGRAEDEVDALAAVLHERTHGLPGVAIGFLKALKASGVLTFEAGAWHITPDAVKRAPLPKSAAAHMAAGVEKLEAEPRAVLNAASMPEHGAPVETLARWLGWEKTAVAEAAAAAASAGVLSVEDGAWRPAHPLVRRAALDTMDDDVAAALHVAVTRDWFTAHSSEERAAHAFAIVRHLAHAPDALDGADAVGAAELCAQVAADALAAGAFADALSTAELGLRVAARGTDAGPALLYALRLSTARAHGLLGDPDAADAAYVALQNGPLDSAQALEVVVSRVEALSFAGRYDAALSAGLAALAGYGVRLPAHPSALRPLPRLLMNHRALEKRGDTLLELPACTDERAKAVLGICVALCPPTYLARPNLFLMVVELGITWMLKYGRVPAAPYLLGTHAMVASGALKKYASGYRMSTIAKALMQSHWAPQFVAKSAIVNRYFVTGDFELHADMIQPLEEAAQTGQANGDALFAGYCAVSAFALTYSSGKSFDDLDAFATRHLPSLRSQGQAEVEECMVRSVDITNALRTPGCPALADALARAESTAFAAPTLRNMVYMLGALGLFALGEREYLPTWFARIGPRFYTESLAAPYGRHFELVQGLLAAERGDARTLKRVAKRAARTVAEMGPYFSCVPHALAAEVARLAGQNGEALLAYGLAAQTAQTHGQRGVLAVVQERRADLLYILDREAEARLFLREAHTAYKRWGHGSKVAALEAENPWLRALSRRSGTAGSSQASLSAVHTAGASAVHTHGSMTGSMTASGTGAGGDALDLGTVLKVGQAISQQLETAGVVRAVLEGVVENAGADRAVLVLAGEDGPRLEAVLEEGAVSALRVPLDDAAPVPVRAVRQVLRQGTAWVTEDAQRESACRTCSHVQGEGIHALAVVPITSQGKTVGAVVLENRALAGAFTADRVRVVQALATQAAISLDNAGLYADMEARVARRTAELDAANQSMRLVLDHVSQGLVVVARDGTLAAERSSALTSWFGTQDTMDALLRAVDAKTADWFAVGWDMLCDGMLPAALCLEQLPRRLTDRRGETPRTFDLAYDVIDETDAGDVERVLVVMTDVTAALEQERLEALQKESMALFARARADRRGLAQFRRDAQDMIDGLMKPTAERAADAIEKRWVHTLKGNAALLGQTTFASVCHAAESSAADEQRAFGEAELVRVKDAWDTLDGRLGDILDADVGTVRVSAAALEALESALIREDHPRAVDVERMRAEAVERSFARLSDVAAAAAQKLGKAVEVHVEHGGIYTRPDVWGAAWASLVHVVRNAVDHGLEPVSARDAAGKAAAGQLWLRAFVEAGPEDDAFVLELRDDGRGINWGRVAEKARAAGLPADAHADLVDALFADGMSTKDEATELSGRGVGLAAVREQVHALGGHVDVQSTLGKGTCFTLTFPAHTVIPAAVAPGPADRDDHASATSAHAG